MLRVVADLKETLSNELTVLNNQEVQGNVNFTSRFFKIKPGTLNIVQPNSQNGTRGNLRISETGQEFKSMRVALLLEPRDERAYYEGDGNMNRQAENLSCFTRNVVTANINGREVETQGPDKGARNPQALKCANCPQSSWDEYRKTESKDDIPPCDRYIKAYMIDTQFKLPLQMYIRSKSKKPWEKGMDSVARTLMTKYSQDGKQTNFYDVAFTLSTEAIKNKNGTTSYILKLSDFAAVTPEEREAFGKVYDQFTNKTSSNDQEQLEAEAQAQVEVESEQEINSIIGSTSTSTTEQAVEYVGEPVAI